MKGAEERMKLLKNRVEISVPTAIDTTAASMLTLEIIDSPPVLIAGSLLATSDEHIITSFYCPLTMEWVSTLLPNSVYEIQTIAFSSVKIIPSSTLYYRLSV